MTAGRFVPRSLSFAPVAARLSEATCSRALLTRGACRHLGCDRAIAERLGITRRTVVRWKREGLSVATAERIAHTLGTHPSELWSPAAWNVALDDYERGLARLISWRRTWAGVTAR